MKFRKVLTMLIATCAMLLVGVALGACGRSVTSRYKLTLAVETPEGVKTAFGVLQSIVSASGPSRAYGEAIYLDLGTGRRPLIALITAKHANKGKYEDYQVSWSTSAGPMSGFFLHIYGDPGISTAKIQNKRMEERRRLLQYRGPRPIAPKDLPDIVTFADISDPKSVMLVDPYDLEATLGPGVKWKSITLEVTDEPVTGGIETKLPWLTSWQGGFDGTRSRHEYGPNATIANSLTSWNFIRR